MKQVNVKQGNSQSLVELNGVDDNATLTPSLAIRAARIAAGFNTVTVFDEVDKFRVTKGGARRIK